MLGHAAVSPRSNVWVTHHIIHVFPRSLTLHMSPPFRSSVCLSIQTLHKQCTGGTETSQVKRRFDLDIGSACCFLTSESDVLTDVAVCAVGGVKGGTGLLLLINALSGDRPCSAGTWVASPSALHLSHIDKHWYTLSVATVLSKPSEIYNLFP